MSDWIIATLGRSGYAGIALLMLLENVFPPIPSELIMPFAGFASADGQLRLPLVIVAGSAGSVLGALFWYAVGRWMGQERLKTWASRHGRWMALSPPEIDRSVTWFETHCGKAVLLGRLVPAVRTLISVPAGIATMPIGRFLLYSSIGTLAWSALLATAGYMLEDRFERVEAYLNPVSTVVVGAIVLWYVVRVITFSARGERA